MFVILIYQHRSASIINDALSSIFSGFRSSHPLYTNQRPVSEPKTNPGQICSVESDQCACAPWEGTRILALESTTHWHNV